MDELADSALEIFKQASAYARVWRRALWHRLLTPKAILKLLHMLGRGLRGVDREQRPRRLCLLWGAGVRPLRLLCGAPAVGQGQAGLWILPPSISLPAPSLRLQSQLCLFFPLQARHGGH